MFGFAAGFKEKIEAREERFKLLRIRFPRLSRKIKLANRGAGGGWLAFGTFGELELGEK